jgi:hypothetical protein
MSISPLFEAAFYKRTDNSDYIWELLDALEWAVERAPRLCGERHPGYVDCEMWVWESPPISRFPRVAILYEIVEAHRRVILWNFKIL